MTFNAITIENFVSKRDADALVRFVQSIEDWDNDGKDGFWDGRSLNAVTVYEKYNKDVGLYLYELRDKVAKAIANAYGEEVVYPDLFQIVRWFPGQEQPPHCDDMTDHKHEEDLMLKPDGPGLEWYEHRHYGSIIYLNDDYNGGQTYYPQHDVFITPKAGMLAVHPGDPNHMHGVTTVKDSIRYTIASFWTREKEYYDSWTPQELH